MASLHARAQCYAVFVTIHLINVFFFLKCPKSDPRNMKSVCCGLMHVAYLNKLYRRVSAAFNLPTNLLLTSTSTWFFF